MSDRSKPSKQPEGETTSSSPSYMLRNARISASHPGPGLYIVATPIGNLSDITIRALDVLASADLILCEDTRTSRRLLDRFDIFRPVMAYHDHSRDQDRAGILARLERNECVALVSDAGTPLISDPGFKLISSAIEAGHPVVPIPGPSSVLAALSAAGLPTDAFYFAGFLPNRAAARRKALSDLKPIKGTLILFESAKRAPALICDARDILGDRPVVIARELTKIHEEFHRGSLAGLCEETDQISAKGEMVVLIGPGEPTDGTITDDERDALLRQALSISSVNEAARHVAQATGLPKRALYRRALQLKANTP